METLGRTSHFRLGESVGWLGRAALTTAASLELSTSTGVVALLEADSSRDERSDWEGREGREDSGEDSFRGLPFCIGIDSVVDGGCGGDGGAVVLSLIQHMA
jgi:hypothetical protein